MEALAPARYRVQFTADAELRDQLERLQALMRSSVPDGDLGALIKVAVAEKLERLEAQRFAKTNKPRKTLASTDTTPNSRHIPAAVRRRVHARDGGRCAYVNAEGKRCQTRARLEFHHDGTPYARGGDHSPENIRLVCRTHNMLLAEQEYGREKMARYRSSESHGTDLARRSQGNRVAALPGPRVLAERSQDLVGAEACSRQQHPETALPGSARTAPGPGRARPARRCGGAVWRRYGAR